MHVTKILLVASFQGSPCSKVIIILLNKKWNMARLPLSSDKVYKNLGGQNLINVYNKKNALSWSLFQSISSGASICPIMEYR